MLLKRLRPHHLLCISFYEGKGYSPNFVRNMNRVVESLEDNPSIQLVSGFDCICVECPHMMNKVCDENVKVERYDKAVLSACDLKPDQILKWKELRELVFDRIIIPKKLNYICGDCQWNTICQTKQEII